MADMEKRQRWMGGEAFGKMSNGKRNGYMKENKENEVGTSAFPLMEIISGDT